MGTSKISVDLSARSFEIEVPDERIDDVLSRLEGLFQLPVPPTSGPQPTTASETATKGGDESEQAGEAEGSSQTRKRRTNPKGPSKVRAYQLVELGLTSEQRNAIREDFEKRAPAGQNEQVAVLAVKLEELLKKADFSADEIHSAFKVVNKPTPKNLIAVFGNMKRDGRGNYSDNRLMVNSHTQDYVNFHMGSKAKSKD